MNNNTKSFPFPIPELLAPAGNMEKFRSALLYGANAIYLGGDAFNLRASCQGLSKTELTQAVKEAESKNAKVYYCLNSFPRQENLSLLPQIIEDASECGVHAFIVADPGIVRQTRKYAPHIPLHISTQANTANSESVAFWAEQGASRVNLARELGWKDIEAVRANCPETEIEIFAHGAMCLALSGQCLLSSWLNQRPANHGRCTQPCRFEYKTYAENGSSNIHNSPQDSHNLNGIVNFLESSARSFAGECPNTLNQEYIDENLPTLLDVEEKIRPGRHMWSLEQGEDYSAFWAPEDLCLLPFLPWLIRSGVASLKMEGRMKSAAYVAQVTDIYSTALQYAAKALVDNPAQGNLIQESPNVELTGLPDYSLFEYRHFLSELLDISSRPLSSGFFLSNQRINLTEEALKQGMRPNKNTRRVLARIVEPGSMPGSWVLDVKYNWEADMAVSLMLPGMQRPIMPAGSYKLENHRGENSSIVSCGTKAVLHAFVPGIQPGLFICSAGLR